MKTHSLLTALSLTLCAAAATAASWTTGMTEGKVTLKSAGPLTFGPEGILFVADTRSAAIIALATGDKPAPAQNLKVEGLNQKVAALLGTAAEQVTIEDLAVNPESHAAYLAVTRGRGAGAGANGRRVVADWDAGTTRFARRRRDGGVRHRARRRVRCV